MEKITEREKGQIEAYRKILSFIKGIKKIEEPMPYDMWEETLKNEIKMVESKRFRMKMEEQQSALNETLSKLNK